MPSRDPAPSAHPSPEHLHAEGRRGSESYREPDRPYGRGFEPPRARERGMGEGAPEAGFTHEDSLNRDPSGLAEAARKPRPAPRVGPGQSHGASVGRASGSQAYGDAWPDPDGAQDRRRPERPAQPAEWERRAHQAQRPALSARSVPSWRHSPQASEPPAGRPGLERPDDSQFDADYHQWREEQMRLLDRDYAQWRQERYRKFAEEFSQWRSQRLSPRPGPPPRTDHPDPAAGLGHSSALGPIAAEPPMPGEDRGRDREERERGSGGGLLSGLLGGHSERSKP